MALFIARKVARALGMNGDAAAQQELVAAGVPVSDVDCRTCTDPCEEGM